MVDRPTSCGLPFWQRCVACAAGLLLVPIVLMGLLCVGLVAFPIFVLLAPLIVASRSNVLPAPVAASVHPTVVLLGGSPVPSPRFIFV